MLEWATASELNNAGFEVQHAFEDGFFELVAFVEGRGTTVLLSEYAFEVADLEPGRHAFRLRQVDFDGTATFSDVVELEIDVPYGYWISEVYPNPFNPEAVFRFWVSRSQHVEATLHDIQGRMVKPLFEGMPASDTSTLVRIDGSNLSSGNYLIRLQGEDFITSRRVTLMK